MRTWCEGPGHRVGAILSLDRLGRLASAWYRDTLAPDWRRRTSEEASAMFDEVGLGGPFWTAAAA